VKRKAPAFKLERKQRTVISEQEALKRMKEFSKRKEQFLATAAKPRSGEMFIESRLKFDPKLL